MRRTPLVLLGAVVGGLLVAGCSSGTADTTLSSDTTALGTTTVTTPAATTTTTTEEVVADAGCVTCHTDQATLQAMAVEPVAEEILSEGEG